MKLLSINIPTYERLDSFCEIVCELEKEIINLPPNYQSLIEINVFENHSSAYLEKKDICEKISSRSNIALKFNLNSSNIGGDENIAQCCIAGNSIFTWVLGDDDHIVSGSLIKIIDILLINRENLGLLILRGEGYEIDEGISGKWINSYFLLSHIAIKIQPHFLIAHTLISCNIFRSSIFNLDECLYVIRDLTRRLQLSANFGHMRGLIKGLLSNSGSGYSVIIPEFNAIDTSRRLPSSVDFSTDIYKIYYFYFQWLLTEVGIGLDQVARHDSVSWLYEGL